MGGPLVASRTLHPAPPESYTVFMTGCNFRCLHCQNWGIAHYPASEVQVDGWVEPQELAEEAVSALKSARGQVIGADRIFFSGGGPTCSLPYVEEIVREARRMEPDVKVNFDTNGFMTAGALGRILDFTTSITYDLRARDDEVHREITGAPVEPVLRNARIVADHPEQLWEFRILLIPGINQAQVRPLAEFFAAIDPDLPVSFLAFRPNFVLENHPGATTAQLQKAVEEARQAGLQNVHWAGRPGLSGERREPADIDLTKPEARQAAAYSLATGCETHPRDCGRCWQQQECPVKDYRAVRRT
ncbi:MAG: radical SAM protein [Armatimonadota bacterium]